MPGATNAMQFNYQMNFWAIEFVRCGKKGSSKIKKIVK